MLKICLRIDEALSANYCMNVIIKWFMGSFMWSRGCVAAGFFCVILMWFLQENIFQLMNFDIIFVVIKIWKNVSHATLLYVVKCKCKEIFYASITFDLPMKATCMVESSLIVVNWWKSFSCAFPNVLILCCALYIDVRRR